MPLDKSWIDCGTRCSVSYFAKIDEFLDFAYANKDVSSTIYCPCRKCRNRILLGRSTVRQHFRLNGFWVRYKIWTKHGEPFTGFEEPAEMDEVLPEAENYMDVEMTRLVEDAIGTTNVPISEGDNDITESENATPGPTESTREFLKLMQNANLPLYPGSKKHTALSFAVRLLQAKSLHGWTDTSSKELLDIFSEVMPEGVNLPKTYYQAEKLVEDLGFTFKTVDACPNDCMLFRNENEGLNECLICKASRWRKVSGTSDESGTRRAAKQARYFPLIPRLQRLFATAHSANLMKWHGEKRVDDGVFRHPADSPAWKHIDTKHASFAADIRNVRLGIASDGFNPFRNQNLKHSTWPVVIIPYNLPPMLILNQPYIYLSVLIDGPRGPGDKIDVYLEPLIEELNESWEVGVETYDASTNQMFQMRAALLWSINDFPAYANISGWSTKGEYGCPKCNTSPGSKWLNNGRKWSYGKSRRFTPLNHPYRRDAKSFHTGRDFDEPPPSMTGAQHLLQLQSNRVLTHYKKEDMILRHNMGSEKAEKDPSKKKKHNWKKKSILYELPYWVDNLLPYSIDAMHVEKNVAENVIYTILGVKGKSKDNLASRRDLKELGIRKQYHVKVRESGVEFFEGAEYEMDNDGKYKFLLGLSESRMPDGSCSSIARRVNLKDRSIGGIKSHDYHILLQQLIPLCVRSSLPKKVVSGLIDLGKFFKVLCSKTNSAADLEKAKADIILTLCDLEKIFPPSYLT